MHMLLFDLSTVGHHASYIRHLLHYWPDSKTTLHMVVSPGFLQEHGDVIQTESMASVRWTPITADELQWYTTSQSSPLRLSWIEWQLFCRYAKKVNAGQGLVMYMDRFQLPLALHLPLPCPLSGIYFRPKFHYASFESHRPTKGEWLKVLREQLLWRSALRHPKLKTLFSLDPFAVEPLHRLGGMTEVVHLPDPVEIYPPSEDTTILSQELAIDPLRKVFLLFGVLDKRKGIHQVLEALRLLSISQQAKITLLLVGPLAHRGKEQVSAKIRTLTQTTPIQVIIRDQYVADDKIQPYFEIADVVLALYQHHVGMSAILVRAAAAGKPVLASDYGLMGELARLYRLGVIVDSAKAGEVAIGIKAFLKDDLSGMFDGESVQEFAKKNSAALFTETLWKGL